MATWFVKLNQVTCNSGSSFTDRKSNNTFFSAATPATPLQRDPQLSWVTESFNEFFEQIVFVCDVDTTGLDPAQDLLDVAFKIGETVMKAYTAFPYGNLPARLEAMEELRSYIYKDETEDKKLAYFKTVSLITSRMFLKNSGRYCFGVRRRLRYLGGRFALYLGCY